MAVYYQTYRPKNFLQIVGQKHVVVTLKNAIIQDKISHALLFTGPRGTGKTTMARIVTKALNCLEPNKETGEPCNNCDNCSLINKDRYLDLFEIDAASNRGIDDIRELRQKVAYKPTQGNYKVYIIDEAHMLTNEAFNALLKTLEEPPKSTIFILCTTEMEKVPETIISRCQVHGLRPLQKEEMVKRLIGICKKENIKASKDALKIIARTSKGGLRDAIGLLEQTATASNKKISVPIVNGILGKRFQDTIPNIIQTFIDKDDSGVMNIIEEEASKGTDFQLLLPEILEYLHEILHAKYELNNGEEFKEKAEAFDLKHFLLVVDLFNDSFNILRYNPNPRLLIEKTCIQACRPEIPGK